MRVRIYYAVNEFDNGTIQIARGRDARQYWLDENKEGKRFVELKEPKRRKNGLA